MHWEPKKLHVLLQSLLICVCRGHVPHGCRSVRASSSFLSSPPFAQWSSLLPGHPFLHFPQCSFSATHTRTLPFTSRLQRLMFLRHLVVFRLVCAWCLWTSAERVSFSCLPDPWSSAGLFLSSLRCSLPLFR